MKNFLLLFVLLVILPGASFSQQTLVRGAYLNIGTPSSMIVRWRTDSTISTVDSKIWYGTQLDTSTMMTLFDATLKTNHEINITGLTAATKYFYAVGTSTEMLSALDSTQYFKTSPPVGDSSGTVRIWAIGDFGEGNTNQGKVRDAYKSFVGNKHTDVWVWLGDNAYDDGRDNEYQSSDSLTVYWYRPFFCSRQSRLRINTSCRATRGRSIFQQFYHACQCRSGWFCKRNGELLFL